MLVKMGPTGPLVEARRGPQAGKSGDPRSQNTDIMLVRDSKTSRWISLVMVMQESDGEYVLGLIQVATMLK